MLGFFGHCSEVMHTLKLDRPSSLTLPIISSMENYISTTYRVLSSLTTFFFFFFFCFSFLRAKIATSNHVAYRWQPAWRRQTTVVSTFRPPPLLHLCLAPMPSSTYALSLQNFLAWNNHARAYLQIPTEKSSRSWTVRHSQQHPHSAITLLREITRQSSPVIPGVQIHRCHLFTQETMIPRTSLRTKDGMKSSFGPGDRAGGKHVVTIMEGMRAPR